MGQERRVRAWCNILGKHQKRRESLDESARLSGQKVLQAPTPDQSFDHEAACQKEPGVLSLIRWRQSEFALRDGWLSKAPAKVSIVSVIGTVLSVKVGQSYVGIHVYRMVDTRKCFYEDVVFSVRPNRLIYSSRRCPI